MLAIVRRIVFPVLLALGAAALPASAKTVLVHASGMSFTPATINIDAGDSVTFQNDGGFHNVKADDGSFRCSQGCDGDGQGGNGDPSTNAWSFTRTFTAAGSIPFHCEVHGFVGGGMHGTIVVSSGGGGGGGSDQHGTLQFSAASYTVTEGTAQAQIAVTRSGGDDGAVSVHFAATALTATAGSDFTAVSGTLNWAAGDDASKTFAVPIKNDAVAEPSETVGLALSAPVGGATLGTASAVLTVFDNDSAGSAPATPQKLRAASTSLGGVVLSWQDKANNETGFRIEARRLDEPAFAERGTAPANATGFSVQGLDGATAYAFRVRAENAAGLSAFTPELLATTDTVPAPCVADATTLCLGAGGRFRATIDWRSRAASGHAGAIPLPANPDSGLFFFFGPANIEALIKVLNSCAATSPRYWAFFAATTDVEFTLRITDSASGKGRVYFNPLGQPAPPVQDTDAFATCP